MVEHEALVVFENKNVKSPDAEEFDQEAVFFHEEASVEEPTAPLGSLGLGMMDTGGKPDPNRMGAIIGEFERSGLLRCPGSNEAHTGAGLNAARAGASS